MKFAKQYSNSRAFRLASFFALSILLLTGHIGCGSDAPSAEIGEELSGGATTVFVTTNTAFNHFANNLNFQQQGNFKIGNSFFEQDWVTAPASAEARDGLGPTFNANSCSKCHNKDGRGAPPLNPDEKPVALLFRLSIPGKSDQGGPLPEPNYGEQLNPFSIANVDGEATISASGEEIAGTYGDGTSYSLFKPSYEISDLNFGALHPDTMISPRVAPQMVGMGLLEAISESDLLAQADPQDQDGDSISGRPNYVWDLQTQQTRLGRFGWKANQPSVAQQVAGAFLGDIGITSSLFPQNNCPPSQQDCLNAINGGEPEIEDEILDLVIFYSKTLAVPARRNWEDAYILQGKQVFNDLGCAKCHTPKFQTSADYPIAELTNQTIRPYSDLLLHDMGEGLADHRPDFEASGSEWRTPPLWGTGLIETVNGHTRLLHDGRARNFEEAILWHGGESESAKEAFRNSPINKRQALIEFLKSL